MIGVKTGIRPEEVRLQGQHVLFVEGSDKESVDPKVLNELFSGGIRIEPLGPSFSVRSVAEALQTYHPTYYFLIDRDHYDDSFIEERWDNFPDSNTNNLLVWRRREIENYFLDPDYLSRSKFCRVSQGSLEKEILQSANDRLFLDVANHVVIHIREELKENWIQKFTNPEEFSTKEDALRKLQKANEFGLYSNKVQEKVSLTELERRFSEFLERMTGGQKQLSFGVGEWLDLVQGKKVFNRVVNNSACFQVTTADGTALSGRVKMKEIVKDLLRKGDAVQPRDFTRLKNLIIARIEEPT
ncbi:MAG: hypothetical protein OXI58_07820 [Gemmatimonadota bacterium]|nr:hypothetical protein [Gemmatimonadota bacterium]